MPLLRRLAVAAALIVATTLAGAQAGGGMRGGGGPGGPGGTGGGEGGRHGKPGGDDAGRRDAALPPDLAANFARRLREGRGEFGLRPEQARPYDDFVDSLDEVGRHNERRLMRISHGGGGGAVSASAPLQSYLRTEVADGQERQEALVELQQRHAALQAALDEGQREHLSQLFIQVRGELLQRGGRP